MSDQNAPNDAIGEPPRLSWCSIYLLELKQRSTLPAIGLVWILVWGGVAFALVHFLGNPLTERKLERVGFRVQGPITHMETDTRFRVNQKNPMGVNYEFLDFAGKKHTGHSLVWSAVQIQELQKSGIAVVLYLPQNPDISKLEGGQYPAAPAVLLAVCAGMMTLGLLGIASGMAGAARRAGVRRRAVTQQA